MSTVHPVTAERPTAPIRHAREFRLAFVAAVGVAALIVGLAGGYLFRWGTEPQRAAKAYSTAATVQASVYFDGSHAFYSGPAEMAAGTTLVITFTTTAPNGALAVSRLSPAPTWQQLVSDIASANTSPEPMPMGYVHPVASVEGSGRLVAHLSRAGVYALWAGPLSTTSTTATVAPATMLRVTP